MKNRMFRIILLFLSLLATIKICILGLGIDEEYAVTMSYRIVTEDRMFLEMWEPHQTSGFLTAFLINIFVRITGGTEYLILYLRFAGALIQALISLFLYRTLRRGFPEEVAFVIAIFFYNTLPKWIQTPEFANMLVWFSTLAFTCFLRYYMVEGKVPEKMPGKVAEKMSAGKVKAVRSKLWLVAAGISLSAMVLSYPSVILAIPVILLGMWMLGDRPAVGIVLGTCAVPGIGYILFFLNHMTVEKFIYGLSQMMTDGSHDTALMTRMWVYGQELLGLLGYVAAAVLPALIVLMICRRLRNIRSFLLLTLIFSLMIQIMYWLGDSMYLQEPLVYFYLLFLSGILMCHYGRKGEAANTNRKVLFWMGSVAGVSIWLSALAVTNTTISVTGSYLMPGLISGILFLWEDAKAWGQKYLLRGFLLCLLAATLFVKGFLVCSTEGIKDDVTLVRQKALYGPAKGIHCRYIDGYAYNTMAELLAQYTAEECPVLYVGEHSLYYLLGSQTISNFSTISTPTYDERLGQYWDRYPERVPKIVVCDAEEENLNEIRELLEWGPLLAEQEVLQGLENIRVYEILGRRK